MTKARDLASASIVPAAVSVTELGYIDGVTSAIQTQINAKAATAATINPSIVDAKGDLIAATAADTVSRLAVGANDTVLTADSAAATGMKWAAAGGDYVFLSRTTFSSVATQAFDNVFTSTYGSYNVVFENFFAATALDDLLFQFRYAGPTTEAANYFGTSLHWTFTGTTPNNFGPNNGDALIINSISGDSTAPSRSFLDISGVGDGSRLPMCLSNSYAADNQRFNQQGGYASTARIYTGFILSSSASNISGTVAIYGRK